MSRAMRPFLLAILCISLCALYPSHAAHAVAAKPLQIYFIDVEGGQATLLISPSGESLLIDTGWAGFDGRDADRIKAAANQAGLTQIDYVLITHHHRDHVGGVPQLVDGMKVGTFIDHGPNMEDADVTRADYAAYEKAIAGHTHVVAKPGWVLPIKGINVQVISSAGDHITKALPGAGAANPYCVNEPAAEEDKTENARSLGTLITFGQFRFLDLGDLTKKKELELACPDNLIGTVDLFLVTHHGWDLSNSKPMDWGLHPRVAIFDNGPRKGATPAAWQVVHDIPGIEDIYQLHYAVESDHAHNVADDHIVNLKENCEGKYLKVTAEPNGSFTVTNSRTGVEKTYAKK